MTPLSGPPGRGPRPACMFALVRVLLCPEPRNVSYGIAAFVSEQLGRTRDQILRAVEWELLRVDYKLKGTRRARARAAGAQEYRRLLAGLGFLLRTGLLPRVAAEPEFLGLRPLCEDLVRRGVLAPQVLAAFTGRQEVERAAVGS